MSKVTRLDEQPVVTTTEPTPAALFQMAVQSGADIEKLEKLMEMQLRWEGNEARKAFVEALTQFKRSCPKIQRTEYSKHNDFWHESIESIAEVVDPLLSQAGLSYTWKTEQSDKITVHFDVTHVQGHSERTTLSSESDKSGGKNAIQAIGSAVTYLQRYTMRSGLGLAIGDKAGNDDGNGSSPVAQAVQQREQAQPRRSTSVAAAVAEESNEPPYDPIKAKEYKDALEAAIFDADDAAILECWQELDNNGKTAVWKLLGSADRKAIMDAKGVSK